MAKGIYKLKNNRTGKSYIGQTNNLARRKQEHMSDLAKGTHHNSKMQRDYDRGDTFSFQVLEYVDGAREDLNRREMFNVYKYDTFNNGYNQTHGGDYHQSNPTNHTKGSVRSKPSNNTKKLVRQNNGYRRKYKKKQYPIRTRESVNYKTSGDKWVAYILIALFILYLISYWPMYLLYGILISIAIIIIAAIAYFGGTYLYNKYLERKNIFYCRVCKKRVKFVDGHCPNCYKKNKERVENAKKTKKTTNTNTNHSISKSVESNNSDSYPYCNYKFKSKTIDKLPSQNIENKNKENPKHSNGFKYPSITGYKFCPNCGKRIKYSEEVCINCSNKDERLKKKFGIKICPKCFSHVPKNAIRCKYCKTMFKKY